MTEPHDPMVQPTDAGAGQGSPSHTPATDLRTFLIADIRGYSAYTREHGDEAGAALAARFAELVEEVVKAREGFVVELRGDEALVVFDSARRALRAAMELQARFKEDQLPRGVGIGLDAGEAIPVGSGYRGSALNLAARLCGEAGPGETLASEAVIHLAAKMDGIAYVDARALKLKGFGDAVRVVDVIPSELAKGRRIASGNGWVGPGRARFAVLAAVAVLAIVGVLVATNVLGFGIFAPSPSATPGVGLASTAPTQVPSNAPTPSSSIALPSTPDPLATENLPLLAFYDAATGAIKTTTDSLRSPRNISFFADGSFWILGDNPLAFNRVDPETHEIVQSISIGVVEASGFNFDENSIWVTDLGAPRVVRIDRRTGVNTNFFFAADETDNVSAHDVSIGAGSVWLSRPDRGEITRLNAETGEVQARLEVTAFGLTFGEGALWYWVENRLGRIDPVTNQSSFDELPLATVGWLGNINFGGGYAWTAESTTGTVFRVDRSGRHTSFALAPGSGELASTDDAMWVTNSHTGQLTAIDLVTGQQRRVIDTGHAVIAVSTGNDELMIAVGPTNDEVIASLEGTVLDLSMSGQEWHDPSPDPALNWSWEVRQALYLTCLQLVNYPDEAVPDGWELRPEAADGLPTISPDGRTYTFKIKPGYMFSPPSNEPVTAETFKATIERALSPAFDFGVPGPEDDDPPGVVFFSDIVGVAEYRSRDADEVSGLVAEGDTLAITLEAPAPDFLQRLATSFVCPVPSRTPALRSGLNPEPPVSGAGPYYVASMIRRRLVVLKKNPNYPGPRPQPFDAIAIRMDTAPAVAIDMVQTGKIDGAILPAGEPLAGPLSVIARQWGPASENAAAGDQRWFGAPRHSTEFIALNPSSPAFADADVRRAVSMAIDRDAISSIWVTGISAELLVPSVPGTTLPAPVVPARDVEAARALMDGRNFTVTMQGFPDNWDCNPCRDFEVAIIGQLQEIGITVEIVRGDEYPDDAFEPGSGVDLIGFSSGTDLADPVSLMAGLRENQWLGEANFEELSRLEGLTGPPRIDGAVAFARRLVDEEALLVPTGYPVLPLFLSERIGCGFVQPALGAVDLLSLCIEE